MSVITCLQFLKTITSLGKRDFVSFRSFFLSCPARSSATDSSRAGVIGPKESVLSCRKISRCKWLVTDPPQCRANLRDHFPGPRYTSHQSVATLERRASSSERGVRPVMDRGPHTLRTVWCAAMQRAAHVFPPVAISDPALILANENVRPVGGESMWLDAVARKIDVTFI